MLEIAIFIFWVCLGLILYVYLGYPVLLMVVGIFKNKPIDSKDITPTVTMVISAYNEEKVIREKIENTLALDYPKDKLQILIGSDGSTDKTNEIVKEYAVYGVILDYEEKRLGKPGVLFRCVPKVKSEVILFSDADAMYSPDAVKKLIRHFNDKSIGCVEGVRIDIDVKGTVLESIYWKYETFLKKLASRTRSLVGATGAIFAIRKELYMPISRDRGDDFELPIRIAQHSYGTICDPEAVAFHPWLENEDEYRRIVRIVSWMLPSALILLKEAILRFKILSAIQLLSHKLLRWFVPIFMCVIFLSNLLLARSMPYYIFLLMQMIFYITSLMGYICAKKKVKLPTIANIPYYFCLINFASLVGLYKYLLRRPIKMWKKTGGRE